MRYLIASSSRNMLWYCVWKTTQKPKRMGGQIQQRASVSGLAGRRCRTIAPQRLSRRYLEPNSAPPNMQGLLESNKYPAPGYSQVAHCC